MIKSLILVFVIVTSPLAAFAESKDTISGSITFKCDKKPSYLAQHGYQHIKTVPHGKYITLVYGANESRVVARNSVDKIIGVAKVDGKGNFAMNVKKDDIYQLEIKFLSLNHEAVITRDEAEGFNLDFGYFSNSGPCK